MASDQRFANWRRMLAELEDHRRSELADSQIADDELLARYLSDTCTNEERQKVESAIQTNSAVREIVASLRDVFTEEKDLQFTKVQAGPSAWKRQGTICTLIDRLRFRRDSAGATFVEGLQSFRLKPQLARTMSLDDVRRGLLCFEWSIPLETRPMTLRLSVITDTAGNAWEISGDLEAAPANKPLLEETDIQIHHANGDLEFSAPLQHWRTKPIVLKNGEWVATISTNEWLWRIPLSMG